MDIKIAKYLNGAKGAFTFSFDDGCYKDSTLKTVEIFKEVEAKTGVKIKATVAQTVGFLHDDLINMWKELFEAGYYELASHSVDHCIGYNEDTPEEKRLYDAEKSRDALKEIYGQAPLCFFIPGGGQTRSACSLLSKHYIANRVGEGPINDPDTLDFMYLYSFVARFDYDTAKPFTDYIDRVICEGGYGIQMNHWLTTKESDVHHSQREHTFRDECFYIAERALTGDIWIASMNDAVKYIYEYRNAKISTQGNCITVSHGLDSSVFDMPLTLIISSDEDKSVVVNGTPFEIKAGKENIVTVEI